MLESGSSLATTAILSIDALKKEFFFLEFNI
jgi:hypothetical protein